MRRLDAPPVPLVLILGSLLAFAATAVGTHSNDQLTWAGLSGLVERMVALGIVALGQTFVILARSIDLSVAQVVSIAAVMASFIMQGRVEMIGPAIGLTLAISVAVGLVNGLLIVRARVNPFIATLGVGLCVQGVLSAAFTDFAGSVPRGFQVLAYGSVGGVPVPTLLLLLLTTLCWVVLEHTRFGAHLYAIGGNAEGARQAGIHTGGVLIAAHVVCGALAGLAGLYLAARLRSGAPWIGRDGVYDLQSIAVVVIGGTLLSGGRGGVWGSVAGALLFATLDTMFTMLAVDPFFQQVLRGMVVIAAVAVYSSRSRLLVA